MLRKAVVLLALIAIVAVVFAQEPAKKEEPTKAGTETAIAKHPWGSFKVGSFVTMKSTTAAGATEMTQTLANLDADFATVKTEMKMGDTTMPGTENKMPLKGYATMADSTTKELSKKDEDLKVADKTFKCTVVEVEETTTMGKTVRTSWYCKDVQTGCLKMVNKMKMGENETVMTMTVNKLEDTLKIAGKDVKCIVFESVSEGPSGKSTGKMWMTEQIPGFMAKMESEMKMGETVMKMTSEVIAFEVK